MDIQSLSSLLASQNTSSQQSSAQASASQLSQLLALEAKNGSLIQALVAEVTQLSAKDQQTLLLELKAQVQQLSASLNENSTNTGKPGTSSATLSTSTANTSTPNPPIPNSLLTNTSASESNSLLSKVLVEKSLPGLQARIQLLEKIIRAQAPLQLINLKAGKESIHTLSEKSFSVGESVSLRVRADGQLTFVSNKPLSYQQQLNTPGLTANDVKRNMQIIAESLRQHLPLSTNNKRSLEPLDKLLQSLIKIDRPMRVSLLPPETQKLLGKLVANVFTPVMKSEAGTTSSPGQSIRIRSQLFQPLPPTLSRSLSSRLSPQFSPPLSPRFSPQQVKQAINQSGSFLESNIRKLVAPIEKGISTRSGISESTSNLLRALTRSPQATAPQTTNTVEEDNKAILLKLLDQLNNASQQNNSTNTRAQTSLRDPLLAILKSLGVNPQKDAPVNQLHKDVINELKQLVSTTLSRIQTLQLRTLAQGVNDIATTLLPTVELSLRVNDNIYPFLLYFQEKALKEKNLEDEEKDQKKRKRKLARQWKVFMQFEMDDCGWFASEVSLLDEKVTTRFWAQQNNTQKRLSSRLDDLKKKMEDSGLLVDDIMLLPGEPPRPDTQVQQHLVDVQT